MRSILKMDLKMIGLVMLMVFLTPLILLAQDVPPPVSDHEFVLYLIQSLGGFSGAKALAVVYLVAQILIKFVATPLFDKIFGKKMDADTKLLVVSVLTLVTGITTLMNVEGLPFGMALLHSTTLLAISVLINQIYKKFFSKNKPE